MLVNKRVRRQEDLVGAGQRCCRETAENREREQECMMTMHGSTSLSENVRQQDYVHKVCQVRFDMRDSVKLYVMFYVFRGRQWLEFQSD